MKYSIITISYKDQNDLILQLNGLAKDGYDIVQIIDTSAKQVFLSHDDNFFDATILVKTELKL